MGVGDSAGVSTGGGGRQRGRGQYPAANKIEMHEERYRRHRVKPVPATKLAAWLASPALT